MHSSNCLYACVFQKNPPEELFTRLLAINILYWILRERGENHAHACSPFSYENPYHVCALIPSSSLDITLPFSCKHAKDYSFPLCLFGSATFFFCFLFIFLALCDCLCCSRLAALSFLLFLLIFWPPLRGWPLHVLGAQDLRKTCNKTIDYARGSNDSKLFLEKWPLVLGV